ncbi:copper efflux ATPase (plasmid) [Legionella adelaidensis]|uniref:Copper efflux ATPase n=1 Tax=Legionella adelaidensis TaxID=45056 RepID=A0A0W0R5R5_9GAMM|nr:multicopper oxidase domain-containing protein [Legionella adelaidensis]KTC66386.1 copper efflux ATPase [Legionella adelaidensis]VEH84984.1 copper efflux ATPase [Legionella adelaidensis]
MSKKKLISIIYSFFLVLSPSLLLAQHNHGMASSTAKTKLQSQNNESSAKQQDVQRLSRTGKAIPASTRIINLVVAYKWVKYAGRLRRAISVNNQIPAPTLHFKEGESVEINVFNRLDKGTSIHWHGILVPWQMDGVENVSQKAIPPSGVFHYRFTLHQSGTYWYHAHADVQEQEGLYGAFLIEPKTPPRYHYTKDYVIVLSDWSNIPADQIFANLKKDGDYFAPKFPLQPSLAKFIHDYREADAKERKALINDYKMMQQMRMSIYDLSDVAYDAFLLNGHNKISPWTERVKVGDVVRLRFIGAGGSTIFRVKMHDAIMQTVHIQGNDVKPFPTYDFDIAPGETHDVLVSIQKNRPYIIYAESIDTVGAAVGALVTSPNQLVDYQKVSPFPEPLPTTRQMMENMMMSEMPQDSKSKSMLAHGTMNEKKSKMQGMNMPANSMDHRPTEGKNKIQSPPSTTKEKKVKESMSSQKNEPKNKNKNKNMDMNGMDHSMHGLMNDKNSKSSNESSSKMMSSKDVQAIPSPTENHKSSQAGHAMPSNKKEERNSMSMDKSAQPMNHSTNENSSQPMSNSMDGEMENMSVDKPMTDKNSVPSNESSSKIMNSKVVEAIPSPTENHKSSQAEHSMPSRKKEEGNSMSMTKSAHPMNQSTNWNSSQSISFSTVITKNSKDSMAINQPLSNSMNGGMGNMPMDKPMTMSTEPSIVGDSIVPMEEKDVSMTMGTKYQQLIASVKTNDPNKPVDGVIRMELFGYMDRFIWFINGLPEYRAKPILIESEKRYRIIFTNNSMMRHPMHIHGHWFILRNGHGSYDPLLHTIEVPPGATAIADFDTDASGQWFFHCHHLYHMMAGMARVFQYQTIIEVARGLKKPEYEIASTGYYNRPIVRVDEQVPIDLSLVNHPIGHHAGLYQASFLELGEDPFHNIQELSFKGLYGPDYHKIELYTEDAEVNKGSIEYADMDVFYWHLISQFWALKGGVNYFYRPGGPYWQPGFGVEGLAPYFIDTNIRTYYHQGSFKLDVELSRDTQLFNNFLVRTGIRSILATKTVVKNELGNGLNQMRYIIRPYYRLMPALNVYAEYEYNKDYGAFKRIKQAKGEDTTETSVSLGASLLF